MGPDLGESWNGAGSAHAITRTVRDSAALLDATAGPDVGDPYWAPPQQRPFVAEIDAEPGQLKIAFTTHAWNDHRVDGECVAAVHSAARLCEQLGHRVEEARPEWDEPARAAAFLAIVGAHTRATLEMRGETLGRSPAANDVEPGAWAVSEMGRKRTAVEYARAIRVMHTMGRAVGRFFTQSDVLLTPTMCSPPHPLGVLSLSSPDAEAFRDALVGSTAFTAPFNCSGNPAMSVPLYWTGGGLPIGVQFVGEFGGDDVLFRLAAQLERAKPWAQKRPP
jgi:Asp-tRNA(Asn)/Glu-tRNA(Gln) amidotransferase A subunit family amidase